MLPTLSVLGQTDDEVISFLIYCQREKKQKLTPEQTRYVTEASNYITIDIHPLVKHRDYVSEVLATLTTINTLECEGKHRLFVKEAELQETLRWLNKAFPATLGTDECNPLNTRVNSLISYGRANNVLKRVFGATSAAIVAENPTLEEIPIERVPQPFLARSKTLDLSELQPLHRRVVELRAEHASENEEVSTSSASSASSTPLLRRAASVDSKIPSKFRNFGRKK